jgi:hypothetical protein
VAQADILQVRSDPSDDVIRLVPLCVLKLAEAEDFLLDKIRTGLRVEVLDLENIFKKLVQKVMYTYLKNYGIIGIYLAILN